MCTPDTCGDIAVSLLGVSICRTTPPGHSPPPQASPVVRPWKWLAQRRWHGAVQPQQCSHCELTVRHPQCCGVWCQPASHCRSSLLRTGPSMAGGEWLEPIWIRTLGWMVGQTLSTSAYVANMWTSHCPGGSAACPSATARCCCDESAKKKCMKVAQLQPTAVALLTLQQ